MPSTETATRHHHPDGCPGCSVARWARHAHQLAILHRAFEDMRQAKARRVNRQRGAYRRPGLAGTVANLDKTLRNLLDDTEHKIVLIIAGESDEAATQAEITTSDVERGALEYHGIDPAVTGRAPARDRLPAVLLLLALFRQQQLSLTSATVEEVFAATRLLGLKRLKEPDASAQAATFLLPAQAITLFEGDSQRLYGDLLDGTVRSPGVFTIVKEAATIGAAVLALRNLFAGEAWRVSTFAEHLTWAAFTAGTRAALVDAAMARQAQGKALPQWEWVGPLDRKTCARCTSMFVGPVTVRTLADVPDPTSICSFGRACRHWIRILQ